MGGSTPEISTSHWVNRGFEEDYIGGMEAFLKAIKNKTCDLRSGTCSEFILLGGVDDEGDDIVLLHDDALLPHWKEFATALELLYRFPEASHSLYLNNIQLASSVIDLLKPVLKNSPTTALDLDNNEFVSAQEGIEFAIEIIRSNQKLKKFNWVNNPITSMDDANDLVEAIIPHPQIDCIRLENCFGVNMNAYSILLSILASNKQFSYIDLESNSIRTGGRTDIPDFVATNPPLENLFLRNNHLDDNDAVMISRALKQNTNLRRLTLGENDISDIGRDALSKVIFDPPSLNTLSDSNHSCCIEGIGVDDINLLGICTKTRRARKIYSGLACRNEEGINVHHLDSEFDDDDSLKVVPKVLECVHIYDGYCGPHRAQSVHPLSIVFSILRNWKMPTLYENNGAQS